ncbi:MAG: hypothetical protein A3J54_02830 [Candidatus Ryanbacteria bacterium RIFCSPHIGHO2_02_FULL_45_13b]|uniref:Uncharacterized protein n=1 Tax=Candidatus Ryanbacteria bacterium RIFCSPHIGHO2_02_FULL_45_13b TaxID=1802117 RepID=A0A1G2G6U5_9BACT|nr:MAG: hypothetical protein A3J54_02830 [Candidatus Ryanbacteria bacterium RIFCSPHIGHO2_02_FULL_45_13b]
MGSILHLKIYHDDFLIPGNSPLTANSRKQIRHKSNARIYPRFRPHRKHLRTTRVINFGFFFDLAFVDVFAIFVTGVNGNLFF